MPGHLGPGGWPPAAFPVFVSFLEALPILSLGMNFDEVQRMMDDHSYKERLRD